MKRREFIKYTSQIGLGSYLTALLRHPLQAQERESSYLKNLIYVHFDSGWDVTLGVDPQIKNLPLSDTALFLGYRADEILQIENLRLGPAAHLLKSYALNSIVINGVSMLGNVSHEECRRWTQTGILERRTGGMPAMMAQSRSDDQLAQVVSGQGGLEEGRFSVSPVNPYSLRNFVNVTASESEDFLEPDSIIAQSQKLLNRYGVQLAHVINQNSEIKEMLVNGNTFESTQAAIALCFQTGYARSAVVPLMPGQNSLDTHTNHAREHLPAQKDCFEQLLSLVSFLQKIPAQKGSHSLYDETLIVVSSDFSR